MNHPVVRLLLLGAKLLPWVAGLSWLPAVAQAADSCQEPLTVFFESGQHPQLDPQDFSAYRDAAQKLYEGRDHQLLWFQDGRPRFQAQAAMEALSSADNKGLRASDYAGKQWAVWVEQLESQPGPEGECRHAWLDLALTLSSMRYVSDLRVGRVLPKKLSLDLDVEPKRLDLAAFIQELAVAEQPVQKLEALEPGFRRYRALLDALVRYRELARDPEFATPLAVPKGSVRVGARYEELPRLIHRLVHWGDLPAQKPAVGAGKIYTAAIAEAIKKFQQRHGLQDDGVLGKEVFEQLNVSMEQRVRQILLSLERWRWMPDTLGHRPLVINVPQFELAAFENDDQDAYQQVFDMRVIVGESYPARQTPVFRGNLKHVVFAPYWLVPPKIQKEEMVPKILKDPGYLDRGNYEIVADFNPASKALPANGTNLARLQRGELKIRQRPGARNALGEILFLFPNNYAVYLHGTPSKSLFGKQKRDLSHGCIRVADPPALAAHVLKQEGWDRKRIDALVASGDRAQVNLSQPLDVYVLYTTAVAEPDGRVRFFQDLYGHDARLAQALKLGNSKG